MRPEGIRTSLRPPGRLATRWLAMLEGLDERIKGRVLRGRTLARAGRVRDMELAPGAALAEVQDADVQRPTVRVRTFEEDEWSKVLGALRSQLSLLAKLVEGEVADELLAVLDAQGVPLVPRAEEIDGDCDCGDWAVPCVHGAALHHVVGEALDGEPFLLFTLRGRTGEQLLAELRRGWGDAPDRKGASEGRRKPAVREETEPADVDPFSSPAPPPLLSFRFGGAAPSPAMLELGPLAGDDDLQRALQPLYDAGANAALGMALADRPGDAPRRRRGRSTVPQSMSTRAPGDPATGRPAEPRSAVPVPTHSAAPPPVSIEPAGPVDPTERIVDVLAGRAAGATAAELAAALDLPPARITRELDELAVLGLVYTTGGGRWFVG